MSRVATAPLNRISWKLYTRTLKSRYGAAGIELKRAGLACALANSLQHSVAPQGGCWQWSPVTARAGTTARRHKDQVRPSMAP